MEQETEAQRSERIQRLRDSDPAAYAALPLTVRDHAQLYADLVEAKQRREGGLSAEELRTEADRLDDEAIGRTGGTS